ncbi:hypothetical protein BB560_006982 [Smittium megazygosporum]|uniref:Sorting nexin MVP1 n=1 Tax=Smittium megazygosporum TaxID=133381 RepID=A0A2T9XZN6_9FUNG|nr:hypothetical protein BB560_006982 [Smittium megazygosporum]
MFDIPDPWGDSFNSFEPAPSDLISSSLNSVLLPPVYENTFKSVSKNGRTVDRSDFETLLSNSQLQELDKKQISFISFQNNSSQLSKQNFFIALALVALAQNGKEISLSTLDHFKNALPEPKFTFGLVANETPIGFDSIRGSRTSFTEFESCNEGNQPAWDDAFANSESPAQSAKLSPSHPDDNSSSFESSNPKTGDWRSQNNTMSSSNWQLIDEDKAQYDLLLDDVKITEDPNRGGIVFKHINYIVKSKFFKSQVTRRYNDFFNLSTYVGKKYFFRMLPLIPPKGFPDNRLRGLTNFSCSIMRLPYIQKDEVVKMFFTKEEEISKELKTAVNSAKLENPDLSVISKNIPEVLIQNLYDSIQSYSRQIQKDFDDLFKFAASMERIIKFQSAIADEFLGASEILRQENKPADPNSSKGNYLVKAKAELDLEKLLSDVSMNLSDISLLEKSMSEIVSSTTRGYIKRYIALVYSMKLLVERVISYNRDAEAANLEEKIINSERYKRYKSFNSEIYKKVSQDFIKHHNLMLNSWKQMSSIADMMPDNSSKFID